MEKKEMNLFYIGSDFYEKSGTNMSSIYDAISFKRSDWGKVQMYCSMGYNVTIRPANEAEMKWANEKLEEILKLNNTPNPTN